MAKKDAPKVIDEYTEEDEQQGHILVELHPRLANIPGKPDASGIFHERDERHPDGEVLVTKGRVVKVAPTARVMQAIANKVLIESKKGETVKPPELRDLLSRPDITAAINDAATQALAQATQEIEALRAEVEKLRAGQAQPAK